MWPCILLILGFVLLLLLGTSIDHPIRVTIPICAHLDYRLDTMAGVAVAVDMVPEPLLGRR